MLKILQDGGVIAYCLLGHTNKTTQPLDVGLYEPFKVALHVEVLRGTKIYEDPIFDQFDTIHIMNRIYSSTFTTEKVIRAFQKADIFPVNQHGLLGRARPGCAYDASTAMFTSEQNHLLNV